VDSDDVVVAPTVFARETLDWVTFEETGIKREELGTPSLWHVLVMPKQPKKMSAGGIALPAQAQEVERHQNYIGQVVSMGPLAGLSDKFKDPRGTHQWNVKIGDWVIYGRYAGMHKQFKDVQFLTINDDDITDIIPSPNGWKIHV